MADLRLSRLPDRSVMKLTIGIPPELHQMLADYADAYEAAYGRRETISDLVPFMLRAFLEGDRAFQQRRRQAAGGGQGTAS